MRDLQPGIKIICNPEIKPEIWLSAGVIKAEQSVDNLNLNYARGAFLPEGPWRLANELELSILEVSSKPNGFSTGKLENWNRLVGLVKIPVALLQPLINLGIGEVRNNDDLTSLVKTHEYKRALEIFTQEYLHEITLKEEPVFNGVGFNHVNLPTVTYDSKNEAFIGLHLDSWDHLPYTQRFKARNRICINVGKEDRFLLFLNIEALEMVNMLKNEPGASLSTSYPGNTYQLNYAFLSQFNYPIVKLRIPPNCAYIAPTENMIHDGSTMGKRFNDIHLTWRGYFTPAVGQIYPFSST